MVPQDFMFSRREKCDNPNDDKDQVLVDAKDHFAIEGTNRLSLEYEKCLRLLVVVHLYNSYLVTLFLQRAIGSQLLASKYNQFQVYLNDQLLVRFAKNETEKEPDQVCLQGVEIEVKTMQYIVSWSPIFSGESIKYVSSVDRKIIIN